MINERMGGKFILRVKIWFRPSFSSMKINLSVQSIITFNGINFWKWIISTVTLSIYDYQVLTNIKYLRICIKYLRISSIYEYQVCTSIKYLQISTCIYEYQIFTNISSIHEYQVFTSASDVTFRVLQVCGLKWSPDRQHLASGGNDNKLFVWNQSSLAPVQKLVNSELQ